MLTDLKTALRPALMLTLLFALLLGIAYPVLLTGIGQVLFAPQANGSSAVSGVFHRCNAINQPTTSASHT